ncbi:MAG: tripartite tricarboxylate transporter permease, partial [Geminicoccaceae bacterium]
GFILGPMMENNFARSANLADGVSFMWERPMTLGLLILAILLVLLPTLRARRIAARTKGMPESG